MSAPYRKTVGDGADRSSGHGESHGHEPRHSSHRSKDEPAPEMRQRPHQDYNKGDMRTGVPVSHSGRYSGHRSRDKDHGIKRSTTSSRDERDSASSRSSKEYEHRERDKAREKPLPDPSAGNRGSPEDRSKDLHGDRGTHPSASSRPLHEVSKSRAAPPQETLTHSQDTREEYDTKRDRTMADNAGGEKHEGNPPPPDTYVQPPEGKPVEKAPKDVVMKLDDVLSDTEMDPVYEEARQQQEEQEQTRKDLELAMAVQQEEIEKSRASDRRDEESDSCSESETDESAGTPQAPESQGITSRLYSFVAGSTSPPMTRGQKLRAERDHWKKAYKKASIEAQQWHDQGYKYYMDCTALQRRVEMMDQERRSLASELAHTKQQLSDAINLSEVRGKELKGAQVFLTKADSLSVSDVVQKVAALNEEIFQAGALLAETLVIQPAEGNIEDNTTRRQAIIADTRDTTSRVLGSHLTDLLANESMKPQEGGPANQLLVQIVLLIALTRWCASTCRGWIHEEKEANKFLEELYDDIRKAEDQAVAGRWRSLTRAHLSITSSGWAGDVMRVITSITRLAGWTTQSPDDLSQFEKRLGSIFKALRDVRKATGEEVTSADLEVFAAYRGEDYEPGRMEDSYGDDRASAPANDGEKEKVAGPSGLGLRKVYFVKVAGGVVEKRGEYLSLPKVVLERTVKEAIEPPPPTKPKRKREKVEPGASIMSKIGF